MSVKFNATYSESIVSASDINNIILYNTTPLYKNQHLIKSFLIILKISA